MKGLLVKDFCLIKSQAKFFIFVVALGILFIISRSDPTFGIGYITMLFSFFTFSTISYDEFDNGLSFIMTLPVSRKTYVREKFVFGAILTVTAGAFSSIIGLIMHAVTGAGVVTEILATAGIVVLIAITFTSVTLVFEFKFGHEKGRLALIAFFAVVFAAVYFLSSFSERNGQNFGAYIESIIENNSTWLMVMAGLVCVLIIYVSCLISEHILEKKEF